MSISKNKVFTGPYRATKLWNDTVRSFYNGMPLTRHWRGLRQYENCFTGSEAITWLNDFLIQNPNFAPGVNKDQTIKLLRKFLKSGLIIGARGNKIFSDDFQDNKELYRFSNQSPLKALRTPSRAPLAPIVSKASNCGSSPILKNSRNQKLEGTETFSSHIYCNIKKENDSNEAKDENFLGLPKENFNEVEINAAWCNVFEERLKLVGEKLTNGGDSNAPLISLAAVNASSIRQNMKLVNSATQGNKEGLLSSEELPKWIFSAMKCLVNWPNSSDSVCNIPNYPGVEMDIFKVVREYFVNMVIPLLPFEMYDPIIKVYIGAELLDIVHRTPTGIQNSSPSNDSKNSGRRLSSCDSVEDLMLDISVCGSQQKFSCDGESPLWDELYDENKIGNDVCFKTSCYIGSCSSHRQEFNRDKNRTPLRSRHTRCSSIPKSLKLNRLQNYTNFKDSYLYNDEGEKSSLTIANSYAEGNTSVNTANRVTLKSLKNRSKSSQRSEIKNNIESSNSDSIYDKLLKSEELDNYWLPPNSCFETAFTSDSPKTRIIPQKSVDTIHLRNCSRPVRPKSIAVSSLSDRNSINAKSCENIRNIKRFTTDFSTADSEGIYMDMNRSLSEGNLLKSPIHSEASLSETQTTATTCSIQSEYASESDVLRKSQSSKTSLAARVRDSIKRKKSKDKTCKASTRKPSKPGIHNSYNFFKRSSSYTPFDLETAVIPLDKCDSATIKRLRTKSGGNANPSLRSCTHTDNISINSCTASDLNQGNDFNDYTNLRSRHQDHAWESMSNVGKCHPRSLSVVPFIDSLSNHSDYSSMHCKSQSPSFLSNTSGSASSCSMRRLNRSKSTTPDACLSHSLASSASASLYLSALSGFNQTRMLGESTPVVQSSSPFEGTNHSLSNSSNITTPPELPKRRPVMQLHSKSSTPSPMPCYENLTEVYGEDRKVLSSSANELSDRWADRTPFGTVPPYLTGGIWRHYHSSPSKRLMSRKSHLLKTNKINSASCLLGLLTKHGKDVCIEALQLILLTIEPVRRRKLRLLLKMMARVSANDKLQLTADTNRALVVKTFCRSILLSEKERDYDEVLSTRIVTFLMDNEPAIFASPQNIAVLVHRKLNSVSIEKSSNHFVQPSKPNMSSHVSYCHKVSPNTYRQQRLSGSQQFLFELLDQILDNSKLSDKGKRKKVKEFKMHYPEIYHMRFPPGKENDFLAPLLQPKPHKTSLKSLKKFASIKSLTRSKSIRI